MTNRNRPQRKAIIINDDWGNPYVFADTVHEASHYEESTVLGHDGKPYRYAPRQRLGFDLTSKGKRQ